MKAFILHCYMIKKGIIFKLPSLHYDYPTHSSHVNEIIIATTETLLNKKDKITFYIFIE